MSEEPKKKNNETPDGSERPVGEEGTEAPLEEMTALKQKLEELELERNQFRALAQRSQADFENYQKRAQRDLEQQIRYACSPLALDLLDVLDNLERATSAAQKAGEGGSLVEGVLMVQSQFLDTLRRYGITRMEDLEGSTFDLDRHQALLRQPTADHPPNTIVAVLKQGYMIHDRVLRPADVAVAAPVPEEQEAKSEKEEK